MSLKTENERLVAANADLEARLEAMGEAMLEMARRLDEYERPQPVHPSSVVWSGSSRDYWDNAPEINHEIAQEWSRMLKGAQMVQNPTNGAEIGSERPNHALSQAIEVHEAARQDDDSEGLPDSV